MLSSTCASMYKCNRVSFAREGASLKRSPLPRAPLPKRRWGWGTTGGRGRFSERSASPPRPLSPEERLAFEGDASAELVPPVGWVPLRATCVSPRRLTEPPRTCNAGDGALKIVHGVRPWAVFACVRREGTAARERNVRSTRWQGAAALSAAVTTTKQQEPAPNSHGREPPKGRTSLFPVALRERGPGGEALLLEKRPLPQNLLDHQFFGREREGGASCKEAASLAYLSRSLLCILFVLYFGHG